MSHQTTLYRFYSVTGELLYVGISSNPGRRHHEHSKEKSWWLEVTRSTMEHFATREQAAAAEVAAIVTEHPRHNVVHNTATKNSGASCQAGCDNGPHFFETRYGTFRRDRLVLMPEIHLSACVDDVYGESDDPQEQGMIEVEYWMDYVRRDNGGTLPDSVPIYWSVGGHNTCETAPFGHLWGNRHADLGDFLTHFSWPAHEGGWPINFLRLPIKHRFPLFAAALGWQPSALQPTCPVAMLEDGFLAGRTAQ